MFENQPFTGIPPRHIVVGREFGYLARTQIERDICVNFCHSKRQQGVVYCGRARDLYWQGNPREWAQESESWPSRLLSHGLDSGGGGGGVLSIES